MSQPSSSPSAVKWPPCQRCGTCWPASELVAGYCPRGFCSRVEKHKPPGLAEMRYHTPAGKCPFCLDDLAPTKGKPSSTCGADVCVTAYHRCYARDRRAGRVEQGVCPYCRGALPAATTPRVTCGDPDCELEHRRDQYVDRTSDTENETIGACTLQQRDANGLF